MKKIIGFFKNRIVISLIGLMLFSLLIWFVGPVIKFGEENVAPLASHVSRLIAILIVVILWGLNNLRVQLQNNKRDQSLLDGLQEKPSEVIIDHTSEQTTQELDQINQTFAQALATLKKIKFSGGGRRKALYELPWYIIIGPPGAGKTTALVNSSLEFPLADQFGKAALQGVGGTRHCDWWFTNEAVLIDTAGRYTTQDSHKVADSSVWEGFLELLKKKRRRRPINGAIIAISLQDLLTQSEVERAEQAKVIRARVDELMDKLGIRFPIYLMFTKSDLVAGFSEFFEELNRDEREQVWGVSLPYMADASKAPNFELLQEEYQGLVSKLYERVMWLINQERDMRRRGPILGFPQQMQNLAPIVDSFIRQTFVQNRYQYQPLLRGFYFCSGTQDGTSIDRLMSAVSANFGIARSATQLSSGQGKSYFLGDLFRSVIFPESELVGANHQYERFIRWGRRLGYTGLLASIVGVSLVWFASYTQHNGYMQEVSTLTEQFKEEQRKIPHSLHNLPLVLPALNALESASTVYDQEKHPWLSGLGLYDSSVDANADAAYHSQLHTLLLPRLVHYMEQHLKGGQQGGDLYSTFRIYMMFHKQQYMDKAMISAWFADAWESDLEGQGTIRNQLKAHLSTLLEIGFPSIETNQVLVRNVRATLLRVPVAQRIYRRIRSTPDYSYNVDMLNRFGESTRLVMIQNSATEKALATPYLFTHEGYQALDISPSSGLIEGIINDRWILSDDNSNKVDFINEDLQDVSDKVNEYYLSDYKNHWLELYSNLNIAPFKNLSQANELLSTLVDPVYSPIMAILQEGAVHTQLSNQMLGNLAENLPAGKGATAANSATSYLDQTVVDKQFKQLNALLKEPKNRAAPIEGSIEKIRQLQEFVNELMLSPDPGKQSYEFVKKRYQTGSGGAISSLRIHAKKMPKPVRGWLESMADQTWKVVLQSARHYLALEWKAQVYSPYSRALVGRYPLSDTSRDELAVADFNQFFKPEGTLDGFYKEYLSSFVDTRGSWKNKSIDGRSLGLSKQLLTQLATARDIRKIFFRGDVEMPTLNYQLKPLRMDKQDARFTLEMGEQRVTYSHGPKLWRKVQWQGSDEHSRIRLIFEDLQSNLHTRVYEGAWAWFRLNDDFPVAKTSQANIFTTEFTVEDDVVDNAVRRIRYEIKADSVDNPFGRDILGSFKCPEDI